MVSRLKRPRVCLVFDARNYAAVQTRAADEMGAKACPLNIDRGSPIKRFRRESASPVLAARNSRREHDGRRASRARSRDRAPLHRRAGGRWREAWQAAWHPWLGGRRQGRRCGAPLPSTFPRASRGCSKARPRAMELRRRWSYDGARRTAIARGVQLRPVRRHGGAAMWTPEVVGCKAGYEGTREKVRGGGSTFTRGWRRVRGRRRGAPTRARPVARDDRAAPRKARSAFDGLDAQARSR